MSVERTPDEVFQEGLGLFRNRNYLAAINLWQELQETGYLNPSLGRYLHTARLERSKLSLLMSGIQQELERLEDPAGKSRLSTEEIAALRDAVRARDFSHAIRRLPGRAEAGGAPRLRLEARLLALAGDADPARERIERASVLDDSGPEGPLALAHVLIATGRAKEAETILLDLVQIHPKLGSAWSGLALAYYASERLDLAGECLRKVLSFWPGQLDALTLLDEIEFERTTVENLIEECRTVIAEHPNWPDWHFRMGLLELQIGAVDRALDCFDEALAVNPEYRACLYQRASLRLLTGDMEGALGDFRHAASLQQGLDADQIGAAESLVAQGRTEEAARTYECLLRLEPDLAGKHIETGRRFLDEGLTDLAQREIGAALSLKPGYPDAHFIMARIHRTQGLRRAVESLDRALALNPQFLEAAVLLAESLADLGDLERARQVLEGLASRGEERGDLAGRIREIARRLEKP